MYVLYCSFVILIGGVILAADYSQLELRVIAHLSHDAKLISILNSGGDVFKTIAAQWKGVEMEEVTPEQRAQAKQVHGHMYLAYATLPFEARLLLIHMVISQPFFHNLVYIMFSPHFGGPGGRLERIFLIKNVGRPKISYL